jgi:hypothetical protein
MLWEIRNSIARRCSASGRRTEQRRVVVAAVGEEQQLHAALEQRQCIALPRVPVRKRQHRVEQRQNRASTSLSLSCHSMRGSATAQPMISSSSGSAVLSGVDPHDDAAQQTLQALKKQADRVGELQALRVAAEVVDQRLRDVEQRRNGCCARTCSRQTGSGQEHMTISSAIATLIPGGASSMLSTRLPSLGSGASSGKCTNTRNARSCAESAASHSAAGCACRSNISVLDAFSLRPGKPRDCSTRCIDSTQ